MKQCLFFAAAILLFASCNSDYQKTPSGVLYKIFPGKGDGPKLKAGQFIKMNIKYTIKHTDGKDSVLTSTYGMMPGYTPVDTSARTKFSFLEVLPMCKVGDSVECSLSVDSLKSKGFIQDYNASFGKGEFVHCYAKILAAFPDQPAVMADYQKETKTETDREIKDLQDYVNKKGIKTEAADGGVLVNVETPGDISMKADSGLQVSVKYRGSLVKTGVPFDSNIDTSFHHPQPLEIVLGEHRSIPGMEKGLKFFGKGGKGTIYIPAMLGYGPQGSPPVIPPYSNLAFYVEVLDVKPAPPQPVTPPGMGNRMTPQQMQALQNRMKQMQDSAKGKH